MQLTSKSAYLRRLPGAVTRAVVVCAAPVLFLRLVGHWSLCWSVIYGLMISVGAAQVVFTFFVQGAKSEGVAAEDGMKRSGRS